MRLIPPFPALILEEGGKRTLVVTDLHIGWEVTLAKQGIHIPSQASKMLETIIRVIKSSKPSSLIILGDVKHTIARAEMEEWRDVPEFLGKVSKLVGEVKIIPGNHDGNLEPLVPEGIELLPSTGVVAQESVGLIHGHAWPSQELLGCEGLIMGHMHPVVAFKDPFGFKSFRQVWVKAPCDKEKLARSFLRRLRLRGGRDPVEALESSLGLVLKLSRCLIMPSFNPLLGGQPVNLSWGGESDYIGPLLKSGSVNLSGAEAYLLDGSFLGKVSRLQI